MDIYNFIQDHPTFIIFIFLILLLYLLYIYNSCSNYPYC